MDDAFGLPQSVVVLGGTSEIAGAVLRRLVHARARRVVVAGRDAEGLARVAADCRREGAQAAAVLFDAAEPFSAPAAVGRCFEAAGGEVDLVLVAVGLLGPPGPETGPGEVAEVMAVNCGWPAAAAAAAAERLRAQGHGRIVVLSSVAGIRVRKTNFVYGAAKAGIDAFALGLAEALRGSGVVVQVVRPGFVRTKMTEGRPPAPLATSPDQVGQAVVESLATTAPVVWVPSVLRWAFLVLRHLPSSLWRRLPG